MVPLFAAVIIAGLGIGALLSALAARHSAAPLIKKSPVVVVHTPTPAAAKVVAQHAAEEPTVTVRPTQEAPSPSPHPPTATPAPLRSASPSATPAPRPSATAAPSPKKSVAARVAEENTGPPQRVAMPAAAQGANEAATSLVRRYLEAVAHGNDGAARSALGGDSAPEDVQFLDPSLRITSLSAKRKGGMTEVEVDFHTVKGQYFGTFNVDDTGTRIMQHELIPVGGTTAH
jgi:hypothetical protein